MFWVDLLGWWYGPGFKELGLKFGGLFRSTTEFFSISVLVKTLFQPFRQTLTTSNYKRTFGEKIGDAVVSRTIGFLTRFFLIIFGAIILMLEVFAMGLAYLLWPIVPILPIALVGLALTNFKI